MENRILQLRKERGWSQQQLIQRMRTAAQHAGAALPDDAALRITLSRWENGYHRPSPLYQGLLSHALEMTSADLGLGPRSECPLHLGTNAVQYLEAMFQLHAKADQQIGSRLLLDVVREQTKQAELWTRDARGSAREPLLRIVSRYAEFCGWLHQDQNDLDAADRWTTRAIEMSQELGDQRLVAYALTRRSNIATEAGRPSQGLHLAEAALRQRPDVDSRVVALSLRQRATALALLGEVSDCVRSIERGTEAAAQGANLPHPESDYCTVPYIAMEGGQALLIAGDPQRAIALLTSALDQWPDGQHRDQGVCFARLANAYVEISDIEQACEAGRAAISTLHSAPSARTATTLRHLRARLATHARRPDVAELREDLARAV